MVSAGIMIGGGEKTGDEGGGRWLGDAVSPGDNIANFPRKVHHDDCPPESLRDELDFIFFRGEDAEKGEGLSCLALLDLVCCD